MSKNQIRKKSKSRKQIQDEMMRAILMQKHAIEFLHKMFEEQKATFADLLEEVDRLAEIVEPTPEDQSALGTT